MNKTVKLVNLWGDFEEKHPNASIEDFCLYYLTTSRNKKNTRELFDGAKPDTPASTLAKLITWLARLGSTYNTLALEEVSIRHFEEFLLLAAVANLKEPKKTEAINYTLLEFSTGLNFISYLKARGYIEEYDDQADKRSKRLKITQSGNSKLRECYRQLNKASKILMRGMTEEDIELCTLLLKDIEIKFSSLWIRHKNMRFREICQEMTEPEE